MKNGKYKRKGGFRGVCNRRLAYIIVRHVTGTGLGLLEEIPRSGVQMSALT